MTDKIAECSKMVFRLLDTESIFQTGQEIRYFIAVDGSRNATHECDMHPGQI